MTTKPEPTATKLLKGKEWVADLPTPWAEMDNMSKYELKARLNIIERAYKATLEESASPPSALIEKVEAMKAEKDLEWEGGSVYKYNLMTLDAVLKLLRAAPTEEVA